MTPIYAIAAIAALVWAAIFVRRGSLIGGCLLFVVVGACFGYFFAHFYVGPVPVTLDRLVLLVLLLAYVVQRYLGRIDPKPLGRTDWCLLAFLGVLGLSSVVANWSSQPKEQAFTVFRLATGYLFPFAVYWIARQSPLGRPQLSLVYGTLTVFGAYLTVTGLLEVAGQWWAVLPPHIADPKAGIHFGRARGPMVNAVSFGLHVDICLLALWAWQQRFQRVGRAVLLALAPLMLAAIYFSYTRSAWIGAGLGLATVLGLSLPLRWRVLVLGGVSVACLTLALTRMEKMVSFQRDAGGTAADTRKSVDLRGTFAYLSWKMFLDHPICGVGFNQFPTAKLPYLSDRSTDANLEETRPYVHHNTVLSVLTELGLVGLVLYLCILIGWARAAWGLARLATAPDWARTHGVFFLGVLGIYLCEAVFHEISYIPIDSILVFFLAGLTVGLHCHFGALASGADVRSSWPFLIGALTKRNAAAGPLGPKTA